VALTTKLGLMGKEPGEGIFMLKHLPEILRAQNALRMTDVQGLGKELVEVITADLD